MGVHPVIIEPLEELTNDLAKDHEQRGSTDDATDRCFGNSRSVVGGDIYLGIMKAARRRREISPFIIETKTPLSLPTMTPNLNRRRKTLLRLF